LKLEKGIDPFIRPFIGGEELINGGSRWCLWLKNIEPSILRDMPRVLSRVKNVQEWRNSRNRETTKKLASTPTLFAEIRQPNSTYIAIPTVSSVRRDYLPMSFLEPTVIASNQLYVIPNSTILNSPGFRGGQLV
jgi:hypothetical protein